MEWKHRVAVGVILAGAFLLIQTLEEPWEEAITVLVTVTFTLWYLDEVRSRNGRD